MPTPDQRAAQGASIPAEILSQLPEHRDLIRGGGPQVMSQHESVLAMRVDELRDEIRELRRMLAPSPSVGVDGLPELPQCYKRHWINAPFQDVELFTADQMRAYVLADRASRTAGADIPEKS